MQRNREDPTADSEKPEPMIALPGSPHHIDTGSPLYSAGANLNIYRTHSSYIRYVHSPKTEELKGKKLNTHIWQPALSHHTRRRRGPSIYRSHSHPGHNQERPAPGSGQHTGDIRARHMGRRSRAVTPGLRWTESLQHHLSCTSSKADQCAWAHHLPSPLQGPYRVRSRRPPAYRCIR